MLVFTVVYDRKQSVCRAASALCTCSSGVTMRLDLLLKGSGVKVVVEAVKLDVVWSVGRANGKGDANQKGGTTIDGRSISAT